ncbi:flavin reductase family protein [Rhodococcus pyridinivorans]|nr:flavin reductase family protein [Rhodococcus pyridinivorans]
MEDGVPHATTVSSFSSLSLTPSYAQVILDVSSRLLGVVERTKKLGINLLASHQKAIGVACAGKGLDKLRDVAWRESTGLPEIDDCAGWLACEADELIHVGDHKIVVARPVEIHASDRAPLLYHRAEFRHIGESA